MTGQLKELYETPANVEIGRIEQVPGSRIEHITDSMEVFTEGGTKDTGYIHVGTNNIINNRSEELHCKYRELIRNLKKKKQIIL